MQQFSNLTIETAVASSCEAMEAANHSKNSAMEVENHVKRGVSSKRGTILKKVILGLICSVILTSCGGEKSIVGVWETDLIHGQRSTYTNTVTFYANGKVTNGFWGESLFYDVKKATFKDEISNKTIKGYEIIFFFLDENDKNKRLNEEHGFYWDGSNEFKLYGHYHKRKR